MCEAYGVAEQTILLLNSYYWFSTILVYKK